MIPRPALFVNSRAAIFCCAWVVGGLLRNAAEVESAGARESPTHRPPRGEGPLSGEAVEGLTKPGKCGIIQVLDGEAMP